MVRRKISFHLLVSDYDRSLQFYCDLLGFQKLFDLNLGNGYRHIQLVYPGFDQVRVVLDRPHNEIQSAAVGNQTGDCAWLVVPVTDCVAERERLIGRGVEFAGELIELLYGIQASAIDPDGNRVCLFEDFTAID